MATFNAIHRRLVLDASNNQNEVDPMDQTDIQHIEDLTEWNFVNEFCILTKHGRDAAENIKHGLPVHVKKTDLGE